MMENAGALTMPLATAFKNVPTSQDHKEGKLETYLAKILTLTMKTGLYGEITYKQMDEITGVKDFHRKHYFVIKKLKRALKRDYKRALENIYNKGFRFIPLKEVGERKERKTKPIPLKKESPKVSWLPKELTHLNGKTVKIKVTPTLVIGIEVSKGGDVDVHVLAELK